MSPTHSLSSYIVLTYILSFSFQNSKVDIVLRHIAAKNPEDIPLNDEFKFHSRVLALVDIFIVTRDARRLQVAATRELAINQS